MTEFGVAAAFDKPFQEAVDWFLAKTAMPRAQFDKLAAVEKSKAFTAAYVYKADELQRVYDACSAAIGKGQTLNDFMKASEIILTKPWHRETVFRTNVLSAYGAGHWQQAQGAKTLRPYARYSAVMDGRTRPTHARLHGLVYPLDHEFWKLYWPPWDYNCRCAAITLSQHEIDREGLKVSQGLPQVPGPHNNFVSPSVGEWQPYLGKYSPELEGQVRAVLAGFQPMPGTIIPPGEYKPGIMPKDYPRQASIHPADLQLPGSWKPFMLKKEADVFVQDSLTKSDFYLSTTKHAAKVFKEDGVSLNIPKPGGGTKYFGEGIYLSRKPLSDNEIMLTVKVRLKNPYRYDWNGEGGSALTSFRGPFGNDLRAMLNANPGMSREAGIARILKSMGYDGIIGSENGKPVIVAFDKEQIVIRRTSQPAVPKAPKEGGFVNFDNKFSGDQWARSSNYVDWANNLSRQEKSALRAYKGNDYMAINRYLRYGESQYGQVTDWVSNIDKALTKKPLPENLVVYRGSSFKFFGSKVSRDDLPRYVGAVIEDKGYPSCGISRDAAWAHKGCVIAIKCPKGTPACYLDTVWNRGEYEILLRRGFKYKIVEVDLGKTYPVVHCEVIQ